MLSQHGSGRIVGHEARGFLTCARTKAVKRVWSTNTTEDIYHLHRGQHARANDRPNQTNPPSQVALLQRRSQAKRYDIFSLPLLSVLPVVGWDVCLELVFCPLFLFSLSRGDGEDSVCFAFARVCRGREEGMRGRRRVVSTHRNTSMRRAMSVNDAAFVSPLRAWRNDS